MGRSGKTSPSRGIDRWAPIILGAGILLSGAALAVWIAPMLRSTPASAPTVGARPPDARPPAPNPSVAEPQAADRAGAMNEKMAGFFAALPPKASAAPPDLAPLAGSWTATVVSVDVDGDQAPIRDARGMAPFKFTIQSGSGGWQMAAADGRGTPRTLVAAPGEIVARGDGAPDVHLTLRDGRLVGFVAAERPAKGRIEFHATKDP